MYLEQFLLNTGIPINCEFPENVLQDFKNYCSRTCKSPKVENYFLWDKEKCSIKRSDIKYSNLYLGLDIIQTKQKINNTMQQNPFLGRDYSNYQSCDQRSLGQSTGFLQTTASIASNGSIQITVDKKPEDKIIHINKKLLLIK